MATGDVDNMDECIGIILVSGGSYSEVDQWTGYTQTRQQQLLTMLRNTNMVQITHVLVDSTCFIHAKSHDAPVRRMAQHVFNFLQLCATQNISRVPAMSFK